MSALRGIHHVAYRCRDAAETVRFYQEVLGMAFTTAFAEDRVPSTHEPDPYMHVFLDAGRGNVLAFFELPTREPMGRDPNTPAWVQHIALLTDDLLKSVDALQMAGIPLLTAPNDVYYEMLEERLPGHGEPVGELKARGILLDGSTADGDKRLLLQIFSQPLLGPVFFEFIQRKKDKGFGEGNFKALFESLERDQIRRGTVGAGEATAA